ncbi:MAG: bifunctional metallophosphatase/5'-nucleotidase [Gammaproteobacteria bacterium]|nr:bifunctional metallophosphatase/5'-nucleotidase [Gammaproteobacteria bacterium]
MKTTQHLLPSILASSIAVLMVISPLANAGHRDRGDTITLMQFQDMHGHLAPHAEIFPGERMDPNAGGIAKVATLINQVRASNPNNLLLAVGDTTHGSAETTFSVGDAIMPALNALGIDAFLPGNWDFGYGPRVYRQRFVAGDFSTVLAPNNRTTMAYLDGRPGHEDQHCATPGGLNVTTYATCHVTKANFPTVAINLYNYNEGTQTITGQTHPGYIVKTVGGKKVGIIGMTSDVVPQQAAAFNTGFKFTMGYKELPVNIKAAKAEGAELIVVLSELGLAKNIQLVKEFPEINVMFSGHTHERTPEPIIIKRGPFGQNIGIVTEAGEDSFLGRLDVKVKYGYITDYSWKLMEADGSVAEDPAIKALIDQERKTFVAGPDFTCHTFGANAFPYGKGHVLCDPLETVVGHTNPTIERFDVLEEVANNVMVDAFLDLAQSIGETDSKGNPLTDDNSLSQTNGFRFDVVVLGSDDGFSGDITLGDLYDYYPIGAAGALAEFTGGRLIDHWESVLSNVFDPNPYRQRGGWFLGFTHNMHFDVELNDDFPRTITQGRIDNVTINGNAVDRSKTYTLASCYPHGNPIDEVCRTSGATNVRYIQGTERATGPADMFGHRPLDINGPWQTQLPVNSENIFNWARFAGGGPLFLKVAPDNFAHPTDALRRYLATHVIDNSTHGLGRVTAVTGVPASEYGGPGIVQPTQGAGPVWMERVFTVFDRN